MISLMNRTDPKFQLCINFKDTEFHLQASVSFLSTYSIGSKVSSTHLFINLFTVPSGAPANLTAAAISSTALRIVWRPVPENGEPSCCIHGILAGYKIWHGKRYPTAGMKVIN